MRGRIACFLMLVSIVSLVTAGTADAAKDDTILVSKAGAFGLKSNGDSFARSISADGRFVAFSSTATNLPDDADPVQDVFVRDLAAGTTTLVSRTTGASGAKSNNISVSPSISADGRFVAFTSQATNLPGDADTTQDVFVRDLAANTTTLVSRTTGASGTKGNDHSFDASISADGRFVAFTSVATNLPEHADGGFDVFVRDLAANTTTLVSRTTGATGAKGNDNSFSPSISADGRFVAFLSEATNLPGDADSTRDVFVRDLAANTTTLVSRTTGATGAKGNGNSFSPSISADGRFVAFGSSATNLPDDADTIQDVFVRDLAANTTTLVSRTTGASGAKGNNISYSPSISADGRFVAFQSTATNLPDDSDTIQDVFVRDVRGPQPSPALSIDDTTAKEGNKGTKPFTFTVHLDGVPPTPVTVDYVTIARTAKAPSDYVFTSGTLRFAPGEHEKQIVVQVVGDKKKEPNETFLVRLQNASGAPLWDDRAVGTIKNDDPKK